MRNLWQRPAAGAVLVAVLASLAQAQTTINGNSLALHSTGSASGNAWILDRNGYLGTYITLAAPGDVTIDVQAEGTPDGGVNPNMNEVIADTKTGFDVAPGANTYSHTYSLPAGTFFVRTDFNNDVAVTPRQLTVDSVTVTGATVANLSSSANALAAADSYVANYRKGPAAVAAFGARKGMPVRVDLQRIAFDFGTAVPNTSASGVGLYLGNYSNPAVQTSQQANYQAHLKQNFNAMVPENAGKWASNESTQGSVSMGGVDAILSYAQAKNMHVRMHNLIWGDNSNNGQQPSFVLNNNAAPNNGLLDKASAVPPDATAAANLRSAITSRIQYYLSNNGPNGHPRAQDYDELDVYNESYHTGSNPGALTHNYWTAYGVNGVAGIYNEVKQAVTNSGASTKLYVNEFSVLEDGSYGNFFVRNLESIRAAGIANGYGDVLGGIGSQYYPNSLGGDNPANIERSLQNLDVQSLPITLTEFGVQKAQQNPVTPAQAAGILSDILRLMFGNPNSTGFFMWGFQSENTGTNLFAPQAALYTVNTADWTTWTITDAGKIWQDQLGIQDWDGNSSNGWSTHLATTVDDNHDINFNGYYGDYQLSAGVYKATMSLIKGNSQYELTFNIGAGDYNLDGVVNAADYTVWRDTVGSSNDLRADGNNDGVVNDDDYALWVNNFGTVYPSGGAGSAAAVHEPASLLLALFAGVGMTVLARKSGASMET